MDQELNKAIKIVEDRGGFVMLPENESEERDIRKVTHALEVEKEAKEQALIDEAKSDFENRKQEAFKDATHALHHKKDLSFQDIDDIFFENGIEPDYIEDWIESQI